MAARPGCGLCALLHRTKPSAAWNSTGSPTAGDRAAGGRHVLHILSRPIDVSPIRPDLRRRAEEHRPGRADHRDRARRPDRPGAAGDTPTMLDYKVQADNDSMYNTPPTYSHLHRRAGVPVAEAAGRPGGNGTSQHRQGRSCFTTTSTPAVSTIARSSQGSRSRMNVPFTLNERRWTRSFLKQAKARGMLQLKGHRSVGGMRASIYNAMPLEGVQALVDFMQRVRADSMDKELATTPRQHRRDRQRDAEARQSPRRACPRRSAHLKGGAGLSPRARSAGAAPDQGKQSRPAVRTRPWRACSAKSCRPAWRWKSRCRWLTSGRRALSARRRPSSISAMPRKPMPCASIDEVFREVEAGLAITAWCRWKTPPAARSALRWICCCRRRSRFAAKSICACTSFCCARRAPTGKPEKVYSHAQSLAQCHEWLNQNLPGVERMPVVSNAEAARLAAEDGNGRSDCRRGGSRSITGWKKLAQNIEDKPNNTTRFLVIGQHDAAPSGRDKTSLVMSVEEPSRCGV